MRLVSDLPYLASVVNDCCPLRISSKASRKVSVALSRSGFDPMRIGMSANHSPKHLRSNLGSWICRAASKRLARLLISLFGEAGSETAFGDELLDRGVLVVINVTVCSLNLYRTCPVPWQGILRRAHLAHCGVAWSHCRACQPIPFGLLVKCSRIPFSFACGRHRSHERLAHPAYWNSLYDSGHLVQADGTLICSAQGANKSI